ncbi:MAG TPA: glycosyltransferase family 39 protein, partial [Bryobacteraceae bacterium]|nr:glycosyltransferase family 39 protein [Bryobacteraceae bacterium]
DEADYMYAASLGFFANWTDTPSISISDFAQARDNGRQSLSQRIRRTGDVLFYRHFHGPLFLYLLIPVAHLRLSERAGRIATLAIPAASLAIVYFGCLWLAPRGAILAALLFLSSYSVIGSTELAPHQLFALCSLASLILLLKAIASGKRRYWYGSIVAGGLAFCTLEVAAALLITLAICCFFERERWRVDGAFAAKSFALFLATVLVVWPAALFRLSFLKAYAVMVYLTATREFPWGSASFIETWRSRILHSPFEWVLIVASVIVWVANRRRNVYPIGLFAALVLMGTVRVLTNTPRYSLAFMPALDLLAGLALVPSFGPLRRPASLAVVTLAVVGLYGNACYQAVHQPHNPNPRSAAVLTYIHQNELENKAVLAPQADLPTLHYYFPGMRLRAYFGREPSESERSDFAANAIIAAAEP